MESINISEAPEAVQKAFNHVREHFPLVTEVIYDSNCRWSYQGADGYYPIFENEVNTDILEYGADAQYNVKVPVLYVM